MNQMLWGALAMGSWVVGLFFVRFWRTSRDRLLLFFSLAFWVLSLNWLVLAVANPRVETQHYVYVLRLVAFGLILFGIVDKNRRRA